MRRYITTGSVALLLISGLLIFTEPEQSQGQGTCTPPPSGLIAWWPGDGNYNDIIGKSNGTPANNVVFASGEVGQAFSLNEPRASSG